VRQRLKNFPEIDDLKFNKFIESWCYMKEQFHSYLWFKLINCTKS